MTDRWLPARLASEDRRPRSNVAAVTVNRPGHSVSGRVGKCAGTYDPACPNDIEELLTERGVEIDHVTVYWWVQRFTPLLVDAAPFTRHWPGDRLFIDETYAKANWVSSLLLRLPCG